MTRRRKISPKDQVNGLPMELLQRTVQWKGTVCLHQLGEEDESMLAEIRWPRKDGPLYYACATTGLLFDKQTGRCLQSSQVSLRIETVAPVPGVSFKDWLKARTIDNGWWSTNKHRVKGERAPFETEEEDDVASEG